MFISISNKKLLFSGKYNQTKYHYYVIIKYLYKKEHFFKKTPHSLVKILFRSSEKRSNIIFI